ncbi:hypothetical protein [Acidisphaera rubrifaciens]|nr:hypothetical protein [Acidisphaera rubrifaciens]
MILALPACTFPTPGPQARANAALQAACQKRVDQVYAEQNRPQIYLDNTSFDQLTPFSSTSYVSGNTTRGLAGAYERNQQIDTCLRNTGAATGAADGGPDAPSAGAGSGPGPGPGGAIGLGSGAPPVPAPPPPGLGLAH